jgi:TRAP-type C4-dicarboxylate transport system permease small subunit
MRYTFRTILDVLGRIATFIEDTLLVLLLTGLIGFAALQIFQRNILGSGFVWTDELLRMMVLAIALVGALAASRDDNHINIDVFTRFLPPLPKIIVRILVDAFTTVTCGFVAWHSLTFVNMEKEAASVILNGFPAWVFQSIIPLCFGLIAWRYLTFFMVHLYRLIKKEYTI